jgi:hypothetical protein
MVVGAAVAAMAMSSLPSKALALGFNFGDAGFFVYGGDTERYENFGTGSAQSVFEGTAVTTSDIGGDLATLNTGASTGLRYSLLGTSADGLFAYFSTPNSGITPTQAGNSFAETAAGEFLFWAGQHAAATGGASDPLANNPSLTSKAAVHSFTSFLTTTGTLNGQLNFNTHGALDQLLNIFKVNVDGLEPEYELVATAMLTGNGQLTVTPTAVPVPAAVVLFATGLVGLAGMARRSLNRPA